jgi:hypothetical protein
LPLFVLHLFMMLLDTALRMAGISIKYQHDKKALDLI